LEVDAFWPYVGNKKNKIWLYHRETSKIVSYVWRKRNSKAAKLKENILQFIFQLFFPKHFYNFIA